ncbi:hypothetical protein F7734_19255 [Scytonema sp. UIC 10036]|uniref:hypothetical protein n=1 Tax=Scytonema sp. UIC 10036 TaxID=2304196 RepID=UPI0012DABB42|nr:hypothetical protein [Scytonema sp. UIC 10036]MUG94395.1 hypothetical protein [Scytonema sp. UIC 10036]
MFSKGKSNWDLSVDDRNGQRTLVVEVKKKRNASPEWAARLRHNILAHGTFPKAPYFLMAFPDRLYLWTDANGSTEESTPDYVIDARPIFQPYFEQAGVSEDKISAQSFELIVASWLLRIIHAEEPLEDMDASQQWLIESGLYDAITGGNFENTAAA